MRLFHMEDVWLSGQSDTITTAVINMKSYILNLICKWGWNPKLQNLPGDSVSKAILEKWKMRQKNVGNMIYKVKHQYTTTSRLNKFGTEIIIHINQGWKWKEEIRSDRGYLSVSLHYVIKNPKVQLKRSLILFGDKDWVLLPNT